MPGAEDVCTWLAERLTKVLKERKLVTTETHNCHPSLYVAKHLGFFISWGEKRSLNQKSVGTLTKASHCSQSDPAQLYLVPELERCMKLHLLHHTCSLFDCCKGACQNPGLGGTIRVTKDGLCRTGQFNAMDFQFKCFSALYKTLDN